jgi:hypothetical protein
MSIFKWELSFINFFMYDIFDVISQITGLKSFCGSMSFCIFYLIFLFLSLNINF